MRSVGTASPPAADDAIVLPMRARCGVGLGLLLALTTLAFCPVLQAGFVRWDDHHYVQENARLHDTNGLREMWDPRARATEQYYPLLFTSYWIEYRLWGLDARGYHAANLALHLVNVCLVFLLMRRFGVSVAVALFTAAVFAVHPVQVASVAWVAERKNTLSGLFYLAGFLLYLRHRRTQRWWPFVFSMASFGAGLLVKTQILTLPLSLFLAEWAVQRTGRMARMSQGRVGRRMAPFLALALLAAAMTIRFEQQPWTPTLTAAERILIPANAAWFYLAAFLLPLWPGPIHPQWDLSSAGWWWAAVAAWPPVVVLLACFRRRLTPLTLWGVAHFYIVLLPVLGVVAFNYMTYSFVADHFLYLSVIGGGLALALEGERLAAVGGRSGQRLTVVVGALLLVAAAVRTHAEARHWRTNETFWMHVRADDPQGFLGNYNLAGHYARERQWATAAPFYLQASNARPRVAYPFQYYAEALMQASGPQTVVAACNAKLAAHPGVFGGLPRTRHRLRAAGTTDGARSPTTRPPCAWRSRIPTSRRARASGARRCKSSDE